MRDFAHDEQLPAQWVLTPSAGLRLVGGLLGKCLAFGYKLTGKDQYDDFRLERVYGVPILVTPSVCNPKSMRTGAFFASKLDENLVALDAEVLDMGTGSGICALFAARYARRVVAVDINAAAVRCARINICLNHLEHQVEVRHGDLFTAVGAERFDLVLFNPPFLRGTPKNDRDRAWRSSDVAERFAADLAEHLKPCGFACLLLSSFGDAAGFLRELHKHEFAISLLASRRFINETLAIFMLKRPQLRCVQ